MVTANTMPTLMHDESMVLAQTYQQSMQGLQSIVVAKPAEGGVVMLNPGQLTRVEAQVGQHYKMRKPGSDGVTLETPDNVVAVRHGDALHLRYADGSTASFENFFTVCTDENVCSVNLAGDAETGVTLSGADGNGGVADDGMLVYAHGEQDTLMAMAQGQDSLLSALLSVADAPVITYFPSDVHLGTFALAALGIVGVASATHANGSTASPLVAAPLTAAEMAALNTISAAAENNTATSSALAASVYAAAGVTGVTAANLAAINSTLDSLPINGIAADTRPEVQAIVDAYSAILAKANGALPNNGVALTGAQFTSIGVTGVSGIAVAGNALFLLNDMVDASTTSAVDTVPELQAMATAATHIIGAAGGTAAQAADVTLIDLTALGITGVTTTNLAAVQAAIKATTPDSAIDTRSELQQLVTAVTGATKTQAALDTISTAAESDTATSLGLTASVYTAAGATGVTATNVSAINSALDSQPINGIAVDTVIEIQTLVNAYTAILAEANGATPNTGTPLTGMQYASVGVTGVSGTAAAGNALLLLDDMVNNSTTAAVDSVPELQAIADAAVHVIAAAGGTAAQAAAVTRTDLTALGITGVTTDNLAAIEAAIRATTPDSAIDTQSELQAIVDVAIGTSSGTGPNLTSALSGVANLDVTSNIVLSTDRTVAVGTGLIHITDMGGSGYQGDTSTNTQTIDVSTAIASGLLTISGSGASTKIVINPRWDLDLGSNYQITIDDGAFVDAGGTHAAAHFSPITFSTVTPGTHVAGTAATEAAASQTIVDATGALTAGKSWLNIEGIGNNTGSVTQLGDLSSGAFALVMKNYAIVPGGATAAGGSDTDGIATHDTNVGVTNFGNNDIVYFDSQVNNFTRQASNPIAQFFDARYTSVTDGAAVGGLAGQNALVMGLVSTPQQQGSTAMILLGLEGNTSNKIYPGIVTLNATTVGWANDWHNTSAPVIMG